MFVLGGLAVNTRLHPRRLHQWHLLPQLKRPDPQMWKAPKAIGHRRGEHQETPPRTHTIIATDRAERCDTFGSPHVRVYNLLLESERVAISINVSERQGSRQCRNLLG